MGSHGRWRSSDAGKREGQNMTTSNEEKLECCSRMEGCEETVAAVSSGIPSPDAHTGVGRYVLAGGVLLAVWWALYLSLPPFSKWFTYSLLSLAPDTRRGAGDGGRGPRGGARDAFRLRLLQPDPPLVPRRDGCLIPPENPDLRLPVQLPAVRVSAAEAPSRSPARSAG